MEAYITNLSVALQDSLLRDFPGLHRYVIDIDLDYKRDIMTATLYSLIGSGRAYVASRAALCSACTEDEFFAPEPYIAPAYGNVC